MHTNHFWQAVCLSKTLRWLRGSSRAERSLGCEPLSVTLLVSGGTPTVNTTGAAVQGVMDEEITLHTEHTVTWWTCEYLETQVRNRSLRVCKGGEMIECHIQVPTHEKKKKHQPVLTAVLNGVMLIKWASPTMGTINTTKVKTIWLLGRRHWIQQLLY